MVRAGANKKKIPAHQHTVGKSFKSTIGAKAEAIENAQVSTLSNEELFKFADLLRRAKAKREAREQWAAIKLLALPQALDKPMRLAIPKDTSSAV